MKKLHKIFTPQILGISCVWESPVYSGIWTYYDDFGWVFDQMYAFFSISLLSSRGRNFANTYSISKILYVLKSYDPNSFISDTFDVIRSRYHTENHRCRWANFSKIHLHHPIYSIINIPSEKIKQMIVENIQ